MKIIRIENMSKDKHGNIDFDQCGEFRDDQPLLLEADCLTEPSYDLLYQSGLYDGEKGYIAVVFIQGKLCPVNSYWYDKPLLKTESNVIEWDKKIIL